MRERESPKERVAYAAFASAERLAMGLPESFGRWLFGVGGEAAYHLAPRARRVVQHNLARVLGRDTRSGIVEAATREAFRSYARYWYDSFRARVLTDDEVLRRVRIEGKEHIDRAVESGRGAVMALPHMGNWDVGGRWVQAVGYHLTAVAELLRPRRLYELFERHRQALGMGVVPLSDDRKVGEELVQLLSQNELIALVCDRDLKRTGVVVEMFGAKRRMPAGPALLSLATGSPLLPSAVFESHDGWVIAIDPPLEIDRTGDMRTDVTTMTRLLAARFERSIAAVPTQWHMFQPAWDDADDAAPLVQRTAPSTP